MLVAYVFSFSFLFFLLSFATKSECAHEIYILWRLANFQKLDSSRAINGRFAGIGEKSSAKSRFDRGYSFSIVFIRSVYHSLSLSFFPPHLTTTLRKRSRKYIPFSNAYIYIFQPRANRSTLFFFRGGEQQTRAYLLLPRLKSIFAITRPVHGNSDSRRPVFT